MGERKRPQRPGFKLVQAYVRTETLHRLKIALAIRGHTITQAVNEWAESLAASAPPPHAPPAAKPRKK